MRPTMSTLIASRTSSSGTVGCAHPVPRAQQVDLLAVPEREDDRPPRLPPRAVQRVDHFEQRGDAAGVVVGAVVDVADRAVAVAATAVADVVVVGADQHVLVGSFGSAPGSMASTF